MPQTFRIRRIPLLAATGLIVAGLAATGLIAALAGTGPAAAAAPKQAGVSAAVQGEVSRRSTLEQQTPDAPRSLQAGTSVFMQDLVESGAESRAQILLRDQSSFKLGPKSEIVIDKFVYDPASGSGEMLARAAEGAFRFVTGQIGQADSADVQVETPVATIGIRGTRFVADLGRETEGGTPQGLFVLTGPGLDNNTADRRGAITVSAGGKTVTVRRSGWGTTVAQGGQPSAPRPIPADVMGSLDAQLSSAAPAGTGPGDDPTGGAIASQGAAEVAGQSSQDTQQSGREVQQTQARETQVAEIAAGEELQDEQFEGVETPEPQANVFQRISTWADLNAVADGIATAEETGVPLFDVSEFDGASGEITQNDIQSLLGASGLPQVGSYDVSFRADFANKRFSARFDDIGVQELISSGLIERNGPFQPSSDAPVILTLINGQQGVTVDGGCGSADCNALVVPFNSDSQTLSGIVHALAVGDDVAGVDITQAVREAADQ